MVRGGDAGGDAVGDAGGDAEGCEVECGDADGRDGVYLRARSHPVVGRHVCMVADVEIILVFGFWFWFLKRLAA